MSIASLFKPVDSSKTRLPRTDVLERVAKYADGKSVVSNYFDISTEELINMLRSDLVPAPEVEYVTNIVRGRLSGEVGEAPKKSVGEAIKTTPIKKFTVSDPTKDFITLEDVIGKSTAPTGFERGNYLESLIGSGTTGGPTQRGTPAKGVASADSVDFERGKYLESLIGSGTSGGPTQRGSPAKGKSVDPRIFTTRPIDPYIESGQTAGMSYTPTVSAESVDPRVFTTRPTDPYVEPRQTGGMSYTPQTPTESVDPRVFTTRPIDPYVEPPAADIDLRRSEEDRMPTVGSEFGKRGLAGVAQYLASQPPSGPIDREVPKNRQYTPSDSALKEAITGLVYGSEGVAEAKRAPEEELKRRAMAAGDVTTARMTDREAGIAALPSSTGGAATEGTGGVAPPAFRSGSADILGTAAAPTPTPAAAAAVAPPAFRSGLDDRPSKDEKKAIQETATEVAKNPSVGGIQSLFEQAGFSDALLQLGLGMMASKNPSFLGALGESGQGAVALMAKQREEAKKAKLEADKLELEKQRNAIYGRSVDESGKTDKRPAIVQTSEAYSTAIKTAKEQAKNKLFDTTEQFIARDYASKQIVPAAQEAAQKAATSWDKKYEDLSPSKKKEYEEKNPKDVYVSKAYQASLQQNPELYKLLNIGVPTTDAVDLKSQYNLQ